MDGLEHLRAGAGLLVTLLCAIPGLKILATSQARLNVEGEHLFRVQGLACGVYLSSPAGPTEIPLAGRPQRCPDRAPGDCEQVPLPAVRLFLSSARRIQPGFELTETELADVARICHLLGGLSLAILLAAGWTGMLTPGEIAAELEGESGRGLELLQMDHQVLSNRQQSMRAVFDCSWNLLTDRERQVLAGLSVFCSSFSLEAARQVAGASLWELRMLVDRSPLQRMASGRYQMHELLRQYAKERLSETPGAAQGVHDRHTAYSAALGS